MYSGEEAPPRNPSSREDLGCAVNVEDDDDPRNVVAMDILRDSASHPQQLCPTSRSGEGKGDVSLTVATGKEGQRWWGEINS